MIIGFTGGKGGTGKSTVATAFAYELAKNNKVLLVDADVDCPNDHLLLSIDRKFLKNVEQKIFYTQHMIILNIRLIKKKL